MRHRLAKAWCVAIVGWVAVACAGSAAFGQGAAYEEPLAITELELAGFNRIMGTSPAQKEAAQSLADASKSELKAQESKQAKVGEWFRNKPREERTREDREKFLRELNAADPDVAGMRTKLFADLKAILTEEQRERWRKCEYFVRRERWLAHHNGWNALDRTNLVALVDRLGLDGAARVPITEMLDRYEREMDGALIDLEREFKTMNEEIGKVYRREQASGGGWDAEARKAAMAGWTEAHRRLALLNDDFARRIAAVLPEEKAKVFREMYDRVSLPEGLGIEQGDLAIRGAPDLHGLDDSTRETIMRMVREYAPKYDDLSARITVIERQLRLAQPGDSIDTSTWDPMRMERGNLTGKTHQAILDLLTPAQQEEMIRAGGRKAREWRESMSR